MAIAEGVQLLAEAALYLAIFLILHTAVGWMLGARDPAAGKRLPPGPPGYPVLGALPLLGRAPHVSLANLAERYGPIMLVKMGRESVVVASSPDAARTFLKTLDASFVDRPVDSAPRLMAYGGQDLVFGEYGPSWKLLRKVCSLGMLGPRALEDWAALRRAEMRHMMRGIKDAAAAGGTVKVGDFVFCAIANMISQVIISHRVVDGASDASREFKKLVVELMTVAGLPVVGDYVAWLAWLDIGGTKGRMRRVHAKLDAMWSQMVADHTPAEKRGGRPDLLDALLACRDDDGAPLPSITVKAVMNNLFAAGTDTSSSTIEWAMAEMLLNPAILRQAQEEMDAVIGRSRQLEETDIARLPYLRAVCKEAFRKHPSTPLNLPRVAAADCDAGGFHIAKGTRLAVNIWAIGRDPSVWPRPLEFDPGRFLTEEGSRVEPLGGGGDFKLIPFGAGRRVCAGARMGVTVVQYIVGTLVHAFDWALPAGMEMNMDEVFGIALQKAVPVVAVATPRLDDPVYG